ncbi:MAG: signal peptidase [Planctomycetaceae bacterium]|nr:signal peptidase [Planctomycetaceae bacterium]
MNDKGFIIHSIIVPCRLTALSKYIADKYIVRFGVMRLRGVFSFAAAVPLRSGTRVIVHTPRGQETGTVLCRATPENLQNLKADIAEDNIVRIMTPADETDNRKIGEIEQDEYQRSRAIIESMELSMDLVRIEHLFGGERLIVYYTAETRVDFRELVKMLAGEFHTRIEMRQIGVRDETKLLADFGDCGRDVCCNQFLIEIPPVSMKMAKLQKATLDPNKISGRCGRLKCCLRYEYDQYTGNKKDADDKDDNNIQEI